MTIIDGQMNLFELLNDDPAPVALNPGNIKLLWNPKGLDRMIRAREAHFEEFNVRKGNWKPYRGLSPVSSTGQDSDHYATSFDSDLRCFHYSGGCSCVGTLVYRVYCHNCEHWTGIHSNENGAWEEHLDHCWTGWRNLPVLCGIQKGYGYWFKYPDDYPEEFKQPGSPIRDCRGNGTSGTRHVPSGNDFGGVKVGVVQECKKKH
ncbi:DUF6349 family protein [Glutamicibacter sp. FBE19]|uniref:DUF6349 family protein n=1 Tax=Glutamicibacter sp. FBE19 TaxID=2761534 RepID=UPI001896637A|nr:DUF6349 family protein [Glutamicibacter sp. FBE19]MBF6671547.1 hypothetical protein [Glutamicibacter sp. FBE19]